MEMHLAWRSALLEKEVRLCMGKHGDSYCSNKKTCAESQKGSIHIMGSSGLFGRNDNANEPSWSSSHRVQLMRQWIWEFRASDDSILARLNGNS
jgi:hypothetical protein